MGTRVEPGTWNPASGPREAQGSQALRTAGFGVALAFRLIPAKFRFQAAIVVARWIEPLVKRTRAFADRSLLSTDGLRETSLELVLMMLSRHGTVFSPALHINGLDHMASNGHGGTLIVGPHTMLTRLFVRYLEDAGTETWVISSEPIERIPGTRATARVLHPSATLLFKVRRLLAQGKTVISMIDRGKAEPRASSVETSAGRVFVSHALLRIGLRQRARIVFIATRMDEQSRVVIRLSAPASSSRGLPDTLADFVAFMDEAQRGA
jgi:lauroyl/myristoyl acyltransferase